jgi:SAM-dependent methyltransferase
MSTDKETIAWYNEHAVDYTHHVRTPNESIYHSLYEKPAMYGLLPDLQGKTAISLGCGSGEDCHYLSRQGAKQVEGIDVSEGMIAIAKESYPERNFQVMDMEHLAFENDSFDFIHSSLAMHYIEKWDIILNEALRVLKPGAFFLFSCNHPLANALVVTRDDEEIKSTELSRRWDKRTDTIEIIGDYLDRQVTSVNGWTTWYKLIGEISSEVSEAGFMIANICEPRPLPRVREVSLADFEKLQKIPDFAIFKLWKPTTLIQ